MRLLSGVDSAIEEVTEKGEQTFTRVTPGKWMTEILDEIRSPEVDRKVTQILKSNLRADLRPYQKQGVSWLFRLNHLRLGGILADDMGL